VFGIGFFELIVIGIAILVFFGPDKLPELAQQFGKLYVQIRRMTGEVRGSFEDAMRKAEHDLLLEERTKIQNLLAEQEKSNTIKDETVQKYVPISQDEANLSKQGWQQNQQAAKPDQTSE
jgi:sec-independent protein translocase protein TatB